MKFASPAPWLGKARQAAVARLALPLILGIFLLQAAVQSYMESRLPETLPDPWCSSPEDTSEQCMEVHLFREWQTGGGPGGSAPEDASASDQDKEPAVDSQVRPRAGNHPDTTTSLPGGKAFLQPRQMESHLEPLKLRWDVVQDWRSAHGPDAPVVKLEDLRSARWDGRAPSVACVALVPRLSGTVAWLRRFVDNFRRQIYEGDHWLVLVYHEDDHEGAGVVQQFLNESYIHAAAARSEKYPSAAALRYGAWLASSADVVARWDLDAWHHPDRLSMQVRAMAFAKKPASLMAGWTQRSDNGSEISMSEGERWDGGLVGESRWMREYWWPYSVGDSYLLEPPASHKIVHVDGPELLVYEDTNEAATLVSA